MYTPTPIRTPLMQPENRQTLCQLLAAQPFASRWSVTAAECSTFNFLDEDDRLDLMANTTRFLVLSEPGVLPNVASFVLRQMTRRLSEDWFARFGRQAVLAETFCDPTHFPGPMDTASNWIHLGQTKGFSRANGT